MNKILFALILIPCKIFAAGQNASCGDPSFDLMRNANDCHVRGFYSKSIEYGKKLIAIEKTNSRAYAILAMSFTRNNQHTEALPYYAYAIEYGAGTYDVFGFYAISLDATGDIENAIKWNKRALELYPNLYDVTKSLANQLSRIGKKNEAISLLKSFDEKQKQLGGQERFKGEIMILKDSQSK